MIIHNSHAILEYLNATKTFYLYGFLVARFKLFYIPEASPELSAPDPTLLSLNPWSLAPAGIAYSAACCVYRSGRILVASLASERVSDI